MTIQRTKLLVFGGSGFLGREICRIARAMGHQVISISRSGRPDLDEPWVEGVQWVQADVFEPDRWSPHLRGVEAVVDCMGEPGSNQGDIVDASHLIGERAEAAGVDALVYISLADFPDEAASTLRAHRRAEAALESYDIRLSVLRPAIIEGSDRPDSMIRGALVDLLGRVSGADDWLAENQGIRRETVAICALRAALEHDISGVLDVGDIAHLGDAMFIQ